MSFKRQPKAPACPPPRPPPPKGSMSLGGMSFKKLEQEEEEDPEDLTISDMYTVRLQQAKASPAETLGISSSARSSTSSLSSVKAGDTSEAEDGSEKSSPQRKSLAGKTIFEYKEMLSGLKGKIQGKITKTIEDLSGESRESSASTTPDREHPGQLIVPNTDARSAANQATNTLVEESVTKTTIARLKASLPEIVKSAVKGSHSEPAAAAATKAGGEGPARPTSVPVRASSEEKQLNQLSTLERHAASVPMQLSTLAAFDSEADGDGDDIMVEEHLLKEPFEDFAGGMTASFGVRSRPRLRSTAKAVANVHFSGSKKSAEAETETEKCCPAAEKEQTAAANSSGHENFAKPSHFLRLVSQDGHSLHWPKVVSLVATLFAYFIVPLPAYLSGMIAGCVLACLCCAVYLWLMQPPPVWVPPVLTPVENLPPMVLPEMREPTLEDGVYKGWLNEITNYKPEDYHINHTFSVFVTLEGTKLRLQRPKTPVPRRAMHDENISAPHFIHQRHFDLLGSRVVLQPPGLVKKRVWSKKYPICICLAHTGTKNHNKGDSSVDAPVPNSDMGFELITEEKCDSSLLYLFARTCRDKEEWYKRFVAATQGKPLANPILEMRRVVERLRAKNVGSDGCSSVTAASKQHHSSNESPPCITADSSAAQQEAADPEPLLDFIRYMGQLMPTGSFSRLLSPSKGKDTARLPFTGSIICDSQLYWLNALIGRCFHDFLRDSWWAEKVKDKLQRKLSKIHVPYFIEELQVTAINMGREMPVIRRAASPYLDERGFWVELDVAYSGEFQMTIETKINLMKLKKTSHPVLKSQASERSPVTDSDEEDSAESSTDEEEEAAASPEEKESGGGSRKLLRYLNKLTSTKYFQQATEYKYIKRAMETVSNTPLQLEVTLRHLTGKLAINVPHPPSDRLWYGFRGAPILRLVAKPQVGERVVSITHVVEWIQRKLELEFQRVFVMPNMDDLVIPILRPCQKNGQPDEEEDSSSV